MTRTTLVRSLKFFFSLGPLLLLTNSSIPPFSIPVYQQKRECGVRIITVFLYLNTGECILGWECWSFASFANFGYLVVVEAGGGTDFPLLGLTVMPKRGSALIWPSVLGKNVPANCLSRVIFVSNVVLIKYCLDEDPNKKDPRTEHQALPVEAGTKYGANAWVHQRSFKEPYAKNCI
jgi:prolyl 4-hydroxylase